VPVSATSFCGSHGQACPRCWPSILPGTRVPGRSPASTGSGGREAYTRAGQRSDPGAGRRQREGRSNRPGSYGSVGGVAEDRPGLRRLWRQEPVRDATPATKRDVARAVRESTYVTKGLGSVAKISRSQNFLDWPFSGSNCLFRCRAVSMTVLGNVRINGVG
jgi:hypothetical protein